MDADTVEPLFTYSNQLVKNGCTYSVKYVKQDMDFHERTCEVV